MPSASVSGSASQRRSAVSRPSPDDLDGPTTITIRADNNGEINFGALQPSPDLSFSPSMVFFMWGGCDETDEVSDDGHAPKCSTTAQSRSRAYHSGDETILEARRETSSTAC
jgi:hypothetical protein